MNGKISHCMARISNVGIVAKKICREQKDTDGDSDTPYSQKKKNGTHMRKFL